MNIKYYILCNITKRQHSGEHINTRKFKFRLQESCYKLMYFILFFPFYTLVTEIMEPKHGANSYTVLSPEVLKIQSSSTLFAFKLI